jgi:tRNA(adenine34) deaminase
MSWDLDQLMVRALKEAEAALAEDEVPVGAVVADADGRILALAHNRPRALNDPTAHAEVIALRRAGEVVSNYRLTGCILVVTVEPCIMCMGAAVNARVACLAYGAADPKAGAAGSLYDMASDSRLNHRMDVVSGVRGEECRKMMQRFFRTRREQKACQSGEVPKWP